MSLCQSHLEARVLKECHGETNKSLLHWHFPLAKSQTAYFQSVAIALVSYIFQALSTFLTECFLFQGHPTQLLLTSQTVRPIN